jgi:hypothetical protein
VWALALLAALPALVLAVASLGESWHSVADHAAIELAVRDVGTADTPLVGPYSRYGWNHPGPSLFYALAPALRLVGSADGLLVGSALLNGVAIGAAVVVAGRRGGLALAGLLATLVLAMSLAMGTELLRDPWNPWLAVFPFVAAAVATWGVTTGSARSLPLAVVAASFSTQAHLGYLPLVAALGLVVAGALVVHRRRLADWRPWPVVALALGLALWAPVALDQVGSDPGNLSLIAEQAADPTDRPPGLEGIRSYLLPHLGPTPAWHEPSWLDPFGTGGHAAGIPGPPVGAAAFVIGTALVAWRRLDRPLLLAGVVTATWAGGSIAAARVTGVGPYLTRWAWALGLLLWLSAGWSLWSATSDLLRTRPGAARAVRPVMAVLGGLVVVVLAAAAVLDTRGAPLPTGDDDGIAEVAGRTVAAVRAEVPVGALVEVRGVGDTVFEVPALVVALDRAGFDVQVAPPAPHVFGDHRSGTGRPDLVVVLRTVDPADPGPGTDAEEPPAVGPGDTPLTTVARVDQLAPDERREWPSVDAARPRCEAVSVAAVRGERVEIDEETRSRCWRLVELAPRAKVLRVELGPPPP